MADDQMTIQQFGATIKAKYPAYASRSDEEVGKAMLAKYPQYQSRVKQGPSQTAPLKAEPHTVGNYLSEAAGGVGRGFKNLGTGVYQAVTSPRQTAQSIADQADIAQQEAWKEFNARKGQGVVARTVLPLLTFAENAPLVGGMVQKEEEGYHGTVLPSPEEVGATAEAATSFGVAPYLALKVADVPLKDTAKRVGRVITKTTPKETAELVKETREANEKATTKAAEETAKQQEKHAETVQKAADKRKTDLRKHFEKTQQVKGANEAAEGQVSRKEAINRGVERLDTEVRGDLDKLEDQVNAEGNKRYADLRKVLKDEVADPYQAVDEEGHLKGSPVTLTEHLYDVATEPLRGTETESSIIKSLGKRTEQGDVDLTYNDLQGYREEVGKELRKGSLAPDTFTAYKNLMEAIDDAMGKIAERKGLKPQQDAARAYWRQYRDTFLDSDSPFRKWKNAAGSPNYRPGMGANFIRNADTGIQAIAKYDPALAQRLNNFRGYNAEAKGLPSKAKITSLPKLAPKPETPPAPAPVQPELKTIGAEDVQAKKLNSLQEKGVPGVRKVGRRIVNYGIGLHALWDAFSGRVANLPRDVGLGAAGYAATEGFARLLERPDIQEMLTKPTAEDLAQIPADLRGNLGPMLDAAKSKGINVDPKLYAIAAAPQRKRVASALAPTQ